MNRTTEYPTRNCVKCKQPAVQEGRQIYEMVGGAIQVLEVWLTATALLNEVGEVYAIATTELASGIGVNH